MRDFTWVQAASAQEASRMLAEHGDESRLMAGGTALLLAMRQRMLSPSHVISLGRIAAMREIVWDELKGLRIGALVRHAEIAASETIQARYPVLASMAARVANPQVRNAGTIGGNLCYGDPSTDPPTCLLALGAEAVVVGPEGERVLPLESFFVDYFQTALGPHDVLAEIRVPPMASDATGVYSRFLRTAAEHRPLVNVAVIARGARSAWSEVRLTVGASTAIPARVPEGESFLEGKVVTQAVAERAAEIVSSALTPISDSRGSAEYRSNMIRVITRRALLEVAGQ
jgi:carbon-monoxide dehydrogenase medium subunit